MQAALRQRKHIAIYKRTLKLTGRSDPQVLVTLETSCGGALRGYSPALISLIPSLRQRAARTQQLAALGKSR